MSESQNSEWKESWRDEYLKWICGFANADGGVLTIGRDDNGHDVGIDNAPELLDIIPNKVRSLLGIVVDVNLLEQDDKMLLEIVVEPYPYPISYKGQYHYRSGSTKQELKGAALDQFLLRKQGKHWDGVSIPKVTAEELNSDSLDSFKHQAAKSERVNPEILDEDADVLLESLHLREGGNLKRAAILLFHPEPEKFVTGAYIKIGFFETDVDLRYQDEVHGNLFEQVSEALSLLRTKYMRAEIRYEGEQRIEEFPYPDAALREVLLNAVAHKDYASGIPIQISVYDERILFWNAGQLPDNWTVERLTEKHPSRPYNPDIANAFFRAGLIESWGRGTLKIIRECQDAGLPEPLYQYEYPDFEVRLFAKTPGKTPGKTPDMILEVLRQDTGLSIPEIATQIGKSESAVERAIRKLREEEKLERVGSAKGGHWKVLEE